MYDSSGDCNAKSGMYEFICPEKCDLGSLGNGNIRQMPTRLGPKTIRDNNGYVRKGKPQAGYSHDNESIYPPVDAL